MSVKLFFFKKNCLIYSVLAPCLESNRQLNVLYLVAMLILCSVIVIEYSASEQINIIMLIGVSVSDINIIYLFNMYIIIFTALSVSIIYNKMIFLLIVSFMSYINIFRLLKTVPWWMQQYWKSKAYQAIVCKTTNFRNNNKLPVNWKYTMI